MSSINHQLVADRLTPDKFHSYLQATRGSVADAIDLHDWNTRAGAALHELREPDTAVLADLK